MPLSRKGFTLIELSLAIAILGVVSVATALLVSNMISIYQKGNTIKQVNSVGSSIVEELRNSISNAAAKGIESICNTTYKETTSAQARSRCIDDGASKLVTVKYTAANVNIIGDSTNVQNAPVLGAFCSGTYSYLWNGGYVLDSTKYQSNTPALSFSYYMTDNVNSKHTIYNFRLLKIHDPSRLVCYKMQGTSNYEISSTIPSSITINASENALDEEPIEMLSDSSNNDLVLYDMDIYATAYSNLTGNILYYGTFILGTLSGGINVMTTGDFCSTPNEYLGQDFNYCALNKFNFAAQATGE